VREMRSRDGTIAAWRGAGHDPLPDSPPGLRVGAPPSPPTLGNARNAPQRNLLARAQFEA